MEYHTCHLLPSILNFKCTFKIPAKAQWYWDILKQWTWYTLCPWDYFLTLFSQSMVKNVFYLLGSVLWLPFCKFWEIKTEATILLWKINFFTCAIFSPIRLHYMEHSDFYVSSPIEHTHTALKRNRQKNILHDFNNWS